MSNIRGIALADLHIGIKESERLSKELKIVIDYISKNDDIKIVNIDGDYFDRKLSLTEPAAYIAISFFSQLVEICKEKNIALRIIQGTRSHDLNQLQIFQHYTEDTNLNFKIIWTVQEEDICGLHVLYLPEEYPENSEEYYKDYKNKTYDIIHGHGTWDWTAKSDTIITQAARTDVLSAPVFILDEWEKCVPNGMIIFGHIHNRCSKHNKCFYTGSFTRWNFVDPSDKGFISYNIDPEQKTYDIKYIDNTVAPIYKTIKLADYYNDISIEKYDDFNNAIMIAKNGIDLLRVNVSKLAPDIIAMLKHTYKDDINVVLYEDEKKETILLHEDNQDAYKKYEYIIKRELPVAETIKRFAKEEFNEDIKIEDINTSINVKE